MLLNSSFRKNSFSDICYIRVYDISSSIDTGSCSRDIKCIFLYNRWNRSFFKILHWRRVDRHSLNHIEIFVIILLAYNNINISTHETEEEKRKKKKREKDSRRKQFQIFLVKIFFTSIFIQLLFFSLFKANSRGAANLSLLYYQSRCV